MPGASQAQPLHFHDDIEVIPAQDAMHCSRLLLTWFDEGLLTVMDTVTQEELPHSRARALLSDSAAWTPENSLVLTDAGAAALRP